VARQDHGAFRGRQDDREAVPEQLALGEAVHPAVRGVDRAVAAVEINDGHADRRVPDDLAEQRGQGGLIGRRVVRTFIRHEFRRSFAPKNYTRIGRRCSS